MSNEPFSRNGTDPKSKRSLYERDRQADEALSMRYDAINRKFADIEKYLRLSKPPHDVFVAYRYRDLDRALSLREWEVLGLAKLHDKWRLCHGYDNDANDDGIIDLRPIVECPAEVRLEAVKVASKLPEKIVSAKENHVPKADEAIKELDRILFDLTF